MQLVPIGNTKVLECETCLGLWLNIQAFEKICADKEQQSAVLGSASLAAVLPAVKVNYVPCPDCSQLMNRANFARCSGVIIDVCKRHGIWFDRDELSRIVEFIQDGGLQISRAKERVAIEEERANFNRNNRAGYGTFQNETLASLSVSRASPLQLDY
jgi:Zn-finger nucleic acid-binding protein